MAYLNTPEGRERFKQGFGRPGRSPESYLDEYFYREDIVHHLAEDTGFYFHRDGQELEED